MPDSDSLFAYGEKHQKLFNFVTYSVNICLYLKASGSLSLLLNR